MRRGLGVASGVAILTLCAGFYVGTQWQSQARCSGESAKMRDEVRTLAQYIQAEGSQAPARDGVALAQAILDMNARWNRRTR